MTLLDFEVHFRDAKVAKGRDIYQKGQVTELRGEDGQWIAKMRFGSYYVKTDISGIEINYSSCNCPDRNWSGYCFHSVAVLFAIRKEMNLFPALTNSIPKIPQTDDSLVTLLHSFRDPDEPINKRDVATYTSTVQKMMQQMNKAITSKQYEKAAGLGITIINGVKLLDGYLVYDYDAGYNCIDDTFALFEKWCAAPVPDAIRDAFAHEARVETVRSFMSFPDTEKSWLDIVLAVSDSVTRQQKLLNTLDTLLRIADEINEEDEEEQLLEYKEQLLKQALPGVSNN